MSLELTRLLRPHVAALAGYVPGFQPGPGWIKLNTNENPYPPSPRVLAALQGLGGDALRLYPDPGAAELRRVLAAAHGVPVARVFAGNGSDEVLQLLARAFGGPGAGLGFLVPSYSLYPVLAGAVGAPCVPVEFGPPWALPVERIAACGTAAFFLTSPNAPTGIGWPRAVIAEVAAAFPGLLVVDEAYAAFAEEDAVPLVGVVPNVAVVRTFSKSHSLAGMRVGYLLGPEALVEVLDRLRDSYNLSRAAQVAAVAAVEDVAYQAEVVARVKATRERSAAGFRRRGWCVWASQANFLLVEPRDPRGVAGVAVAESLDARLKARRILVRRFPGHPLTAPCLRVTVGDDVQMAALEEACDSWLNDA